MNGIDYSWLKAEPDDSIKQLMDYASRMTNIFDPSNHEIRPEFIVATFSEMKKGVCKRLYDAITDDEPDFNTLFLSNLSDIYKVKLPDVIHQWQKVSRKPTLQRKTIISKQLKTILSQARNDWQKQETTSDPIPVDYFLGALFAHESGLDVLDLALMDVPINRQELFGILLLSSDILDNSYTHAITARITVFNSWEDAMESISDILSPEDKSKPPISHEITAIEKHLRKNIIGQSAAIDAVLRIVKANLAGLKEPQKPIGVLLFAGYTGVGKTEVARQLAQATHMPFLRLDMSEYQEKHTAARLYGSPPGYVGYEQGGQLTNFVLKNPSSLILFDEVDKAHPDVMNSLLQIAEEGTLTDGRGVIVNFSQTIIILTTNIGAKDALRAHIGFNTGGTNHSLLTFRAAIKDFFRPELIGRLSETIIFEQLDKESIKKITTLELGKLGARIKANRGIKVKFTPKAKAQIVADSNTSLFGARDIKSTIDKHIGVSLAGYILANHLDSSSAITVSHGHGSYIIGHTSQ